MVQAPTPDHENRRLGRARSSWLAGGTFVVGLMAGVLLTGLLGQDPPVQPVGQGAAPSGSLPTTTEGAGGDRLSAACLRAINAAQDIAAAVEDVGIAAAALDAAQLDLAIRQVEPLQQRLQEATADCEVAPGTSPGGPTTGSPSAPTSPGPTASPTD